MKLKELKEILNRSNVLDECEVYAGFENEDNGFFSPRILPHVLWDYGTFSPTIYLTGLPKDFDEHYIDIGTRLAEFEAKDYFEDEYIFDENGIYVGGEGKYNIRGEKEE